MARTTDAFIPEVWSARLLAHLDKTHVYADLLNRDYEGEIRAFGDTVHINQIGDITIRDYDGGDIEPPEELSGNQQTLTIDKAKYFNFQVKDIDRAQTNPKLMDSAMQRASYGINDEVDQVCANILVDGVDDGNVISADSVTKDNAYDYLVDLGTALSEANVPELGRWVVVPPWFKALLQKDQRFIAYGKNGNAGVLENGKIGEAAGFEVRMSNNAPNKFTKATGSFSSGKTYYANVGGIYKKVEEPKSSDFGNYYEGDLSKHQIIAGTNIAATFAEQLVELEAYRLEKNFSDGVKGLNVFGAKVLYPKALAVLTAPIVRRS